MKLCAVDDRKLYQTRAWWDLRDRVRAEEPLCRQCLAEGRFVDTTQIDHIRPHNGHIALFYNRANLQGLCGHCYRQKHTV